ncbi:Fur family transcriptional regulator [Tropicimonas isoalkanivorans]|uniref:Fur family transcriptional regulator, zinc uptake regulator n=1 Tax=Tropicimonas isoalkanivorans TaxID=441112 RepID=A0A1I1FWC5_9RHOB|nr:Fur family transcriptional regulator [Tropicimonas isoalkanivorans]SFC01928.1 Fur family transcriptional regulator, zinc uptake regulator [Tropicimonas isoalkanivorans]
MPGHNRQTEPMGFARHDHDACVSAALTQAVAYCDAEGLRFTPVRRRALEILLERHAAMGAYDVLKRLQDEGLGAQPPAAYRALDFLVQHGFAHRVEGLNAFVACTRPGEDHVPAFLICTSCNRVAEAATIPARRLLETAAEAQGFAIAKVLVEAEGTCAACRERAQA